MFGRERVEIADFEQLLAPSREGQRQRGLGSDYRPGNAATVCTHNVASIRRSAPFQAIKASLDILQTDVV